MKKIMQLFFIGLLGFSMVGCHGCKDPVEDPCEGVEEVAADFKMEIFLGYNEDQRWFEGDTFTQGYVRFSAIGQFDSVNWQVGLDPREFTDRQFTLDFFDFLGALDVKMIGYRKPNNECFPDDDGVDTISKHLVIVHKSESKFFGHYNGYFVSEPDSSFQLFIDYVSGSIAFNEFPKGYPREPGEYDGFAIDYRHFFNNSSGAHGQQGPKPGGWGRVVGDTIIFDFHYFLPNSGGEVFDTYIGVKF